jgi:hypothetical protein
MSNLLWSMIMLAGTMILIGVCAYGCHRYLNVMGPQLE